MKRMPFLTIIIIFFGVFLITSCGYEEIETNMSEPMEFFSFKTQNNKTIGLDDLKGEWWIAYLIYTNCEIVCPRTTANMVNVQNQLNKVDLHPYIISFSVDPKNDTQQALKKYADEHGVNLDTWMFLTNYDFEEIKNISENSFQAVLEQGALDQISHSYMFYLINPEGIVIKKYDGMSNEGVENLIEDLQTVL